MFVKIIRKYPKDAVALIEQVFECTRYEARFWPKDEELGRSCLIIMTRNGQEESVGIGEGDAAFFMNENGRTIDSIDWTDHRVDESPIPTQHA